MAEFEEIVRHHVTVAGSPELTTDLVFRQHAVALARRSGEAHGG